MRDYSKPMSLISLGEGQEIKGDDALDLDNLKWDLFRALRASHEPLGETGIDWDYSEATRAGIEVWNRFKAIIQAHQTKTAEAMFWAKEMAELGSIAKVINNHIDEGDR